MVKNKLRTILSLVSILIVIACNDQAAIGQASRQILSPSDFFPNDKVDVLIVGTFHFNYPGLDGHKTDEKDKIDILSEKRQKELEELVGYIKQFKPNKIAIEAEQNWNAVKKLNAYKSGQMKDERDERYQLAMRLAVQLNLDTLYSVDALSFADDLQQRDKDFSDALWKDYDWQNEGEIAQRYEKFYQYNDQLKLKMSLLDYFKYSNSPEYHSLDYGGYLIGDFELDHYRGADVLSIYWYNRNLRIFRNIQLISESKTDRILVIIGNGHAAVLRQLIQASPQYRLIEFNALSKSS